MADYTLAVLPESEITLTGGVGLDGVTQGDGSHLVGEFMTLGPGALTSLNISDGGTDTNFDDNDGNQTLDGAQTLDGITYADNTRIEAEYQFTLRDNNTGETYQVIGVNIINSAPAFGTIEGLAFVGDFPPRGVALEVISAAEGPGSSGQPPIDVTEFVTCFTAGTNMLTDRGEVAICGLNPGDTVLNLEGSSIQIHWIGRRAFSSKALRANPKLCPIRITAGSLGHGLPKRDLLVSRQHRMLVQSKIAERMFGETEVLVPAVKLTNLPGVFSDESVRQVEYFHLLFDQHEIIYAEGAPSESLFTGPEALKSLSTEAREEITMIFPETADLAYPLEPARYIPSGKQQRRLIARHLKNNKPLLGLPARSSTHKSSYPS